jgi:hypothetical protein
MPDILVKNQTELDAALKNAKGGETIKLLAGTYSSVSLINKNYASNVTVTSADAGHPATIQRVALSNSSNLTFKGLELGRTMAPPESDYTQLHNVNGSSNIVFDSVHIFGGSGDPTQSIGWGMFVRDSANITIKNSTIDHVSMGLQLSGINNLVLKDNTFQNNRRDGVNMGAITNGVVDGNLFTNMFPVNGEHPDAIQFLTANTTTASSNIVIKNNIIMQGDGYPIQGIFMGDEVGTLPFQNVDISNNLIYLNGFFNGINVGHANNLNIQNNTIVSRTDDAVTAWISLGVVDGATISGNIGDRLVVGDNSTNVTVGTNSWLQQDSAMLRKFGDLNALGAAKLSGFIVDNNLGYHPPAGSAAAAIVAAELAAAKASPTRNLLLDLEFKPGGLVEQSRFHSVGGTVLDPTAIANGTYHMQTGKGFEVSRVNSLQIFSLPAFTLTFDLQRDSVTAPTGQVLGVFQGWSVSLQSNGELNFTIKNDAGTSYSITTQNAKLLDVKNHKIGITYDSVSGRAVIYVDNVAKGTGAVSGISRRLESWGLYVGSQYGAAFSGRIGSVEIRDQALSAAQLATLSTASDYGVMKKVSSFAGLVGQIVSGASSQSASAAAAAPAGSQSAMADSVQPVAPIIMASTASTAAAPLVMLTLAQTKMRGMDLFHAA